MADISKVALFTNEYPPYVYGGAGVHVEYLSRELSKLVPVEVRCFGDQDVHSRELTGKGLCSLGRSQDEHRPALWRGAGRDVPQPGDGKGQPGRQHRTFAHLVRTICGIFGQEAVGGPVCANHPLTGAPATLEGGTARQCLSSEHLDREQRHYRSRCCDRGLKRDAQ